MNFGTTLPQEQDSPILLWATQEKLVVLHPPPLAPVVGREKESGERHIPPFFLVRVEGGGQTGL